VNAVQNSAAVESYRAAGERHQRQFQTVSGPRRAHHGDLPRVDGLVQRNDNPKAKRPPFHIGCRTTCIPIVNARFLARSVQTQPLTFDSYNDWLKAQSGSLQDTILGPARADYWRRGKMTLADAIDEDQRVLTLPQLRKRLGLETVRQPAGAF
jgi:hypothetical protein